MLKTVLTKEQEALLSIQRIHAFEEAEALPISLFLHLVFDVLKDFVEELPAGYGIPSCMKLTITELKEIQQQLYSQIVEVINANFS